MCGVELVLVVKGVIVEETGAVVVADVGRVYAHVGKPHLLGYVTQPE